MAANCITAHPITLKEFLSIAEAQGFTVGRHPGSGVNIIHSDGRGCYGISEEEHEEETYVGMLRDPQLAGVAVFEEGSDEYNEITDEWPDRREEDSGQ